MAISSLGLLKRGCFLVLLLFVLSACSSSRRYLKEKWDGDGNYLMAVSELRRSHESWGNYFVEILPLSGALRELRSRDFHKDDYLKKFIDEVPAIEGACFSFYTKTRLIEAAKLDSWRIEVIRGEERIPLRPLRLSEVSEPTALPPSSSGLAFRNEGLFCHENDALVSEQGVEITVFNETLKVIEPHRFEW